MLIRHTLAYLPAQLLSPLLQLAAALWLTYVLAAEDYGLTLLIFASQELAFLACLSWWTTFYLRYGGRVGGAAAQGEAVQAATATSAARPDAAIAPVVLARVESAILLSSSLVQIAITTIVILLTEPAAPQAFFIAASAFTISRSWLNFLSERARREAHIRSYTALQIAAPLGGLLLVWAGHGAGTANPTMVLAAFALSQALVGSIVAQRLGLLVRPQRPPTELLRAALTFGTPVLLCNLLSWLAGNSIRFVVHLGAGAAALGLLSVGWGLATRLAGVGAMLVAAAAYPLAVKAMDAGRTQDATRQLSDNSLLLLALLAPVAVATAVLIEPLTVWLVAPEYRAMTVDILPWALAGACVRNLRLHGWDPLYLLREAPRAMLGLDIVDAVVTTAGALLGLWLGGVKGAVVGTTLAAAVVAAGDWAYLRWRFELHAPFWSYARVLSAALLMGALLHAGTARSLPVGLEATTPLTVALAAAAGSVVYLVMLVAMFPRQAARALDWLRARRVTG